MYMLEALATSGLPIYMLQALTTSRLPMYMLQALATSGLPMYMLQALVTSGLPMYTLQALEACGCTITATSGLPMYTLQALKACGCTMTAASGLPMYITTYYRHSNTVTAVQSPPLCQPVPDRRSACVSDARLYVDRLLAEEAGLLQRTAAVELRQVAAREVRQQLVRLLRPALSSHQLLDHLAPERRVRENVFLRNKTHHLVQVDIIHLPSKAPALRSVTYR